MLLCCILFVSMLYVTALLCFFLCGVVFMYGFFVCVCVCLYSMLTYCNIPVVTVVPHIDHQNTPHLFMMFHSPPLPLSELVDYTHSQSADGSYRVSHFRPHCSSPLRHKTAQIQLPFWIEPVRCTSHWIPWFFVFDCLYSCCCSAVGYFSERFTTENITFDDSIICINCA